jgi:uncharacterized protein
VTAGGARPAFPMFPLGSVLVPGQVLPLHVFEPRYRQLVVDVTTAQEHPGEFGVVLIERGSEVGGGDVRFAIGTVARIVQGQQGADGRYALVAVGTAVLEVERWLDDDPYPRADVVVRDDPPPADPDALRGARDDLARSLRRLLALRAELGLGAAPATSELHDDPVVAAWHAALLCGRGPLDVLEVLALADPAARLARVAEFVADDLQLLEAGLAVEARDLDAALDDVLGRHPGDADAQDADGDGDTEGDEGVDPSDDAS